MDLITLLGTITASGAISIGAAYWLSQKIVEHRLSKDIKAYDARIAETLAVHRAELDEKLGKAKSETDAKLKKEVEEYLGEKNADRQYRSDARKRLYSAVGPLRYQLLVACAEYTNRIARIGNDKLTYHMSIAGYFGQSTAYRLVRILAIGELIERQIAYADFSVDPDMRDLLHFKRQAYLCMSSHLVCLDHPAANWKRQEQHVYYDVLAIIASEMIVKETNGSERALRFDEFSKISGQDPGFAMIAPIPELISDFTIAGKSILWLRFLAMSELCAGLVAQHGSQLGLELSPLDIDTMLALAQDAHIDKRRDAYREMMRTFRDTFANRAA